MLKAIIHSRNGNNNHNHIHDSDTDHNTVNITGLKLKLLTTTPMNINASMNDAGFTLLHIAAFSKQAILVRKLLEIGCDPNVNQGVRTRMTPLISAISSKSYACALELAISEVISNTCPGVADGGVTVTASGGQLGVLFGLDGDDPALAVGIFDGLSGVPTLCLLSTARVALPALMWKLLLQTPSSSLRA